MRNETLQERPLNEAKRLIAGDRNDSYGNPEDDFSCTAGMWSAFIGHEIQPWQVPVMMIMLKFSREKHCHKEDNYVDAAGYAGCAYRTRVMTEDLKDEG